MLKIVSAAIAVSLTGLPALANAPDYRPQDGEMLAFDVYRGDTRFGTHEIAFQRDGDELLVDVDIALRAGFGPVTVFRYEHESSERWRSGALVGFSSQTLKDGETYTVEANLDNDALVVQGETEEGGDITNRFAPSILPSSHWHGYPDGLDRILNTEFGTPMEVTVDYLGEEEISADGTTIRAHHYRLEGSLTVDLWYDTEGRWAGCAFEARGQSIRYERRSAA